MILRRFFGWIQESEVYVFVDESGNDLSKYLMLTGVTVTDARPLVMELYELKHQLIFEPVPNGGLASDLRRLEYFHAQKDSHRIRSKVYEILAPASDLRVDSIIVKQCNLPDYARSWDVLYPIMCQYLVDVLDRSFLLANFNRILILLAHLQTRGSQSKFQAAAARQIRSKAPYPTEFRLLFHQAGTHPYLQVADYCSWAIQRKWETGDAEFFNAIRQHVKTEMEIDASSLGLS